MLLMGSRPIPWDKGNNSINLYICAAMATFFRALLAFFALVLLQGQVAIGSELIPNSSKVHEQIFSPNQSVVSPSFNPSFCGVYRNHGNCPRISQVCFMPVFKLGYSSVELSPVLDSNEGLHHALLGQNASFFSGFTNSKQYLTRVCLWLI